tara:strand:+ start:98 stop:250 length:153 start_codon:yes stop_codon:yes gene_type:complete
MSGKKDKKSWNAIGSTSTPTKKRKIKAKKSRKQPKARTSTVARKTARSRR